MRNRHRRIQIDSAVRIIFQAVSYLSVIALIAMLGFVFYQGIRPFTAPTADQIQIVPEHIPQLTVNGRMYENRRSFIDIPMDAEGITIEFEHQGEHLVVNAGIDPSGDTWEEIITFPPELHQYITSPEAYMYTIILPGAVAGLEQRIHIQIPEPRQQVSAFLLGSEWRPVYRKLYGILPMIAATLLTTAGAVLLGVPLALLSSVLIAEFLGRRSASLVRSAVDLLAGIPSVVYGFFGLMMLVPLIQRIFGSSSGSSLLAAVAVLSVMILPTVISITVTSLKAVPATYREASLALGATPLQTAWRVVFPAARSGITASVILGTARAVGETMAVMLVAGNSPQFPSSLTDSVRTMTATIALEMGYSSGRHNELLFSIGIILFVIIIALNAIIMKLKTNMQEVS